MTHAQTKVRATVKIDFLSVDRGKQLAPHPLHLFLKDHIRYCAARFHYFEASQYDMKAPV